MMFDDDARRKLLTHLNFEVLPTESETQETEERVESEETGPAESSPEGLSEISVPQLSPLDTTAPIAGGEEDFFDNIQTPKTPEYPVERLEDLTLEATTTEGVVSTEHGFEGEGEGETEEAVQRALVVGDFKTAVQHCLASNRIADALILAYVGGSSLWETTQDNYIKKTGRPYLKVASHPQVTLRVANLLLFLLYFRLCFFYAFCMYMCPTYASTSKIHISRSKL